MTLFEALNARISFYRQVGMFGLQRNDAKTVELCINVLNDSLPKEMRGKLTSKPDADGKTETTFERELMKWCYLNLPIVEYAYTNYMNAIAAKYMHS